MMVNKPRRGGRRPARKGGAREREIVKLHRVIGVDAEKVPLSGGARYQGNGEDVDVHLPDGSILRCQVKALSGPRDHNLSTVLLLKALGQADALFLRYDRQEGEAHPRPALVVMPWRTYEELLKNPRLQSQPGRSRGLLKSRHDGPRDGNPDGNRDPQRSV